MLDDHQQLALEAALGERPDGGWASFEVAVVEPRQNGKGGILEARELAGLFLFDERMLIHTAHAFATAKEHFYRVRNLIDESPKLRRRVKQVKQSNEEVSIELRGGQRLRFLARAKNAGSGRGFTGDVVVFDEAMILPVETVGSLLPILSARPNPQVWYTGSAGFAHSAQLHALRRRALAGDSSSLTYVEWAAPEDARDAPHDVAFWQAANPAVEAGRMSLDHIAREFEASPVGEFCRERLCLFDPEPVRPDDMWTVDEWDGCGDVGAVPVGVVALAVAVSRDRSTAALGVAGFSEFGVPVIEVADHRPREGTGWVRDRVVEIVGRHDVVVVALCASSPAGSLIDQLEDAGVELVRYSTADYQRACGALFDLVKDGGVSHLSQPPLTEAARVARKRASGDAFVWDRKDVDVTTLEACTVALAAVRSWSPAEPEAAPLVFAY